MPSTLTRAAESLISTRLLRYTRLFEITRTDATVLRFADHDFPVSFEGNVFIPAYFGSSATDQTSGLNSNNIELKGALDSSAIKAEEIRAGLYRGANVVIYTVDWQYPFAGQIRKEKYVIESSRWTGELFEAQISGLTAPLNKKVGKSISRDCDVERLGDARCGVAIENHRVYGEVKAVLTARSKFTIEIYTDTRSPNYLGTHDLDGLYDFGELKWQNTGLPNGIADSGNGASSNDGIISDIKNYVLATSPDSTLAVQIRPPYDVQVGDKFSLVPGCRRVRADCRGLEETAPNNKPWPINMDNFRGFPDMPGTVIVLKSPNAG